MFCAAPVESVPAASAAPQSKKGNLTALWEYAVKSAVAHKEIAEHEGVQVMQCWNEADQLQDNQEKSAKFKKSLSMKFGPQKGNSIHELVSSITTHSLLLVLLNLMHWFFEIDAKKT